MTENSIQFCTMQWNLLLYWAPYIFMEHSSISFDLPYVSRIMPTNIDSKWPGSQVKGQGHNIKIDPISCGTHFGWIIISCWLESDSEIFIHLYYWFVFPLWQCNIDYNSHFLIAQKLTCCLHQRAGHKIDILPIKNSSYGLPTVCN